MKPEIKAKWCEALRGGAYKQGQGVLQLEERFCCLGVLREIVDGQDSCLKRGGGEELLPDEILDRVGLTDAKQRVLAGLNDAQGEDGAPINTFPRIADWIEENL